MSLKRRDLFRLTGAMSASAVFARLLGCKTTDDPTTDAMPDGMEDVMLDGMDDSTVMDPNVLRQDPDGRWWLSGNYFGVTEEIDAQDLPVEGSIPSDLRGLFVRNGPNATDDTIHWFTGNGMLHGIHFEDGRVSYKNRYIQTLALRDGENSLTGNRGNTSIKMHHGKLLALYEAGLPHEIDPSDLSTVGEYTFGGELMRPMSAHPKIDPATGEMFFVSYGSFAPYATFNAVAPDGTMTTNIELELEHPSMMHDMQLTESYAVLFDLPVHFDFTLIGQNFPFSWKDDAPCRIGLIARDGSQTSPRWFDIDPCYMFHSFNAYEEDGKVIIEGCRTAELWRGGPDNLGEGNYTWRWSLDLETGQAGEEQLWDSSNDFPMLDLRLQGQKHRYAYSLRFANPGDVVQPDAFVRWDRQTEERVIWEPGSNFQPDEGLFVPIGSGEDEGYILSVMFDRAEVKSQVVVLDASDVAAGPIARIALPQRVPFGFHGTFLPSMG